MVKKIIGLLVVATLCFSQTGGISVPVYTAYKKTTLAASAEVITIRKPAGTNRTAFFIDAWIYCSVACAVVLEKNGTYVSGTTIVPTPGTARWGASEILATSGTSISGGSILPSFDLVAGGETSIDLHGLFLADSAENLTFRTSAITGDVKIAVRWESRN